MGEECPGKERDKIQNAMWSCQDCFEEQLDKALAEIERLESENERLKKQPFITPEGDVV